MDKEIRNRIQRATQAARTLLEREYAEQLEGTFDIRLDGTIAAEPGGHLNAPQRVLRTKLVAAVEHLGSGGLKKQEAVAGYLREAAFTMLNRFVALKMLEARGLVQECISRGEQSAGFKEFTGLAPGLVQLPDHGYRLYIESLFDEIGCEVRVLFDRRDPASLLWPRRQALVDLLGILNTTELSEVWQENETIGWVYQYFNSDAERRQMRAESQAPRNSRELAVRNQFFTPRYVVEFLTDNTLGRIWYEMRQGKTRLVDECDYLVRRPTEIFLIEGEPAPEDDSTRDENLSQEELLKKPVYIPFRVKKDPRDLKILDPACGSGHFLLYAFDLLVTIYEEAWKDDSSPSSEVTGRNLRDGYPTLEDLRRELPRLVLRHNLHGIDIDPRAVQIAALALWMRAQRAYNDFGIARDERLPIAKTNIVVAEPMPGEKEFRQEFIASLDKQLGQLVECVFEKMELAGEAGSLLKIEDEIQRAIRDVYGEMGILFQQSDEDRWCKAEFELERALHIYTEQAQDKGAYRRRLFSEDTSRNLGFINVCRNRYDVILMNPPFGEAVTGLKPLLSIDYPASWRDLLTAFVEMSHARLTEYGLIGAISSRTPFFIGSSVDWRETLLKRMKLEAFADLGAGILDSTVETAAYVLREWSSRTSSDWNSIVFRLAHVEVDYRGTELFKLCSDRTAKPPKYLLCQSTIQAIPLRQFVYWMTAQQLSVYRECKPLETHGILARGGGSTANDFRFIRLRSEIPPDSSRDCTVKWVPFAKGGEQCKFHYDVETVVIWDESRNTYHGFTGRKGRSSIVPESVEHYFKPGLTFPRRTSLFSPRALPVGCAFGKGAQCLVLDGPNPIEALAVCASRPFHFFLAAWLGRIDLDPQYEVGTLQLAPYPNAVPRRALELAEEAYRIVYRNDCLWSTKSSFVMPYLVWKHEDDENPIEKLRSISEVLGRWEDDLKKIREELDEVIACTYSLGVEEWERCKEFLPTDRTRVIRSNDREIVVDYLDWILGVLFGRWSEQPKLDVEEYVTRRSPFAPLPEHPPASLSQCIPTSVPSVLCDDGGHVDDIVESAKRVMSLHWKDLDVAIEQLITVILEPDLRLWFASRAFDEHLRHYTGYGRKAPIYWQLATHSSSYSVWLYYHRFTKDTFYKVLNDYVTPKLQHEERKLTQLVQTSGSNPTASQRKEIAEQEAFVEELRAFRQEIARIAPLWNPNLNDGVIINFAPLWRLVPQHRAWQKECKACWDKLVAGNYDWAHLAMHLWPERVVPKCAEDRSLAIAHGLEEVFWIEGDNGKWQPRKVDPAIIDQLINERTSAAVKDALKSLLEAPAPVVSRWSSVAGRQRKGRSSASGHPSSARKERRKVLEKELADGE